MIVEFPLAPTCTATAATGAKARMKNARNAFGAACGVPGVSTFTKQSAFLRWQQHDYPQSSA
jgi:hypothetical protein